jgi:hypothetical protein
MEHAAGWIAVVVTIIFSVAAAAVYLGRLIGSLPGLIASEITAHQGRCVGYLDKDKVAARAAMPPHPAPGAPPEASDR